MRERTPPGPATSGALTDLSDFLSPTVCVSCSPEAYAAAPRTELETLHASGTCSGSLQAGRWPTPAARWGRNVLENSRDYWYQSGVSVQLSTCCSRERRDGRCGADIPAGPETVLKDGGERGAGEISEREERRGKGKDRHMLGPADACIIPHLGGITHAGPRGRQSSALAHTPQIPARSWGAPGPCKRRAPAKLPEGAFCRSLITGRQVRLGRVRSLITMRLPRLHTHSSARLRLRPRGVMDAPGPGCQCERIGPAWQSGRAYSSAHRAGRG